MHDPSSEGNDFFRCDFCRRGWADDRPMIEGHQGSLVCARCLRVAYDTVVTGGAGEAPGLTCTMCLEERDQPSWRSPAFDDAVICLRCIKLSARAFEKDPESGWARDENNGADVAPGSASPRPSPPRGDGA